MKELNELKALITDKSLSVEKASFYLQVSARTVYRWITNQDCPSATSLRKIRIGIEAIKQAFPDTNSTYGILMKIKSIWPLLKNKITEKEKAQLMDIQNTKGIRAYYGRVQVLVEKYKLPVWERTRKNDLTEAMEIVKECEGSKERV